MLAHKHAMPVLAGLLVACLGLVCTLLHMSIAVPAIAASLLAVAAVLVARRLVHGHDLFEAWTLEQRRAGVRWIGVAAAFDVAAVGVLPLIGLRWWLAWLIGVAGWTLVQLVVCHILELLWVHTKPAPKAVVAVRAPTAVELVGERSLVRARQPEDLSHDEHILLAVLRDIGYGWLVITSYEQISDGDHAFGAAFLVRVPAAKLAKLGEKAQLSGSLAEPIAIALSERLGTALETRYVGILKQRIAGLYRLTIVTEDVMSRIYPYRDPAGPLSVRKPALIGHGIDTRPVYLRLDQHGQAVGKTESGKSSQIHCELAHLTLCSGNVDINDDAVVWICGTEKLYDLVAGWLEVYCGTEYRMPFDWVARGPEATMAVLIGLMAAARYRQSVPMHLRRWPAIVCILDEASFALRNKSVKWKWDGTPITMSDAAAMNGQGAASGRCYLRWAIQRDTNDQLGDRGGDTSAQAGSTSVFQISDNATVGRLTGNWALSMPVHKGEQWLLAGDGSEPQLVKTCYIQSTDPSKPLVHDGDTLSDVSWSRRHLTHELDEGTAQAVARAVGHWYAERHRLVTPEFLGWLAGNDDFVGDDEQTGTTGPVSSGLPVEQVMTLARLGSIDVDGMDAAEQEGFAQAVEQSFGTLAAFAAFLADPTSVGVEVPSAPQDAAPREATAARPVPPTKSTRLDAIVTIVTSSPVPLRSADILAALRGEGHPVENDVAVYNQLRTLVDRAVLAKDAANRYGLPGQVYETADHTTVGDSL